MIGLKKYKVNFKFNKKTIAISTFSFLFIFIGLIPFNLYAGLPEIITGAIAFLIRTIADAVVSLLGTDYLNCGLDKLIFNITGDFKAPTVLSDMNISLLRSNTLSGQLFKLYDLFVYIAASLLTVIGLWISFDFMKTANDIKHKVVLKERLTKLVLSIVLLLSIPTCFDILITINQTIVDVFRLFIVDGLGDTSSYSGGFLLDIFKEISNAKSDDIPLAVIYLMSGFLNVWLVFFYMIRDLTICFLFIIAPVIVVRLPYRTDLVLKWFKEMCSNIFTQAVQAFVFTVIVAITMGIANGGTMYDKFFALAAFAMFIPLTATVKKMLGLEGEVGAAKSNAGLGAAIGAIGLAGAVGAGVMSRGSAIRSNMKDVKNIGAEEKLLQKSQFGEENSTASALSSGSASGATASAINNKVGGRGIGIDPNNRTSTNRNNNIETEGSYGDQGVYSATSRARQLQGMKRNAKKEIFKNIAGATGGGIMGGIMAAGTSVYGNPMVSFLAAKGGATAGGAIGETGAESIQSLGTNAAEKARDRIYGEGIRYDGENFEKLQDIFEGTKMPHSISEVKENLATMKSNYTRNNDIIKTNKDNLAAAQQKITGLDANSMITDNYTKETNAILRRNSLERQGKFSAAHRGYANDTYNRNSPVTDLVAMPQSNVSSGFPQEPDEPIITPPPIKKPELSESPVTSRAGINIMPSQLDPIIPPVSNYNSQPTENISSIENDIENLANATMNNPFQSDLNAQMQQYMNNQDYMLALESCKMDATDMFVGSSDSQLY